MSTLTRPEAEREVAQAARCFGQFKTIGMGPTYRVGPPIRQLTDGDWLMEITLVETGEVIEYRLSRIEKDPEAF